MGSRVPLVSRPKSWPSLAAKRAVAIAIADLPIAFGSVARSDEQIGMIGVKRIDEGLGGIDGPLRFLRCLAGLLADHFAGIEFAIPDAFVTQRKFDVGGGSHAMDHQRLVVFGDPQGAVGVVAGEDAPQHVGIGIVVEPPRQPADRGDEIAARPRVGFATKQA